MHRLPKGNTRRETVDGGAVGRVIRSSTPAAPTAARPWESDPIVWHQAPVPQTTWRRHRQRNAAAASPRTAPAGLMNFAADPAGSLGCACAIVAAGTAYDAAGALISGVTAYVAMELRGELSGQPHARRSRGRITCRYAPVLRKRMAAALEYVKKQTPDNCSPMFPIGTRLMNWADLGRAASRPIRHHTTGQPPPRRWSVEAWEPLKPAWRPSGQGHPGLHLRRRFPAASPRPKVAKQELWRTGQRPGETELAVNADPSRRFTGGMRSRAGPSVDAG